MEDVTQDNPDIEQDTAIADDAVPLCPQCLEPCDPLDNYCPRCGSNETINPLASYMPFVNLRFQIGMWGKLWVRCLSPQTSWPVRCFYLFLFLLTYPLFLLIALPFVMYDKLKKQKDAVPQENVE